MAPDAVRPVALVTGASRRQGIAAAIAIGLASAGWDVVTTYWLPYDESMPWGSNRGDLDWIAAQLRGHGGSTEAIEADLGEVSAAAQVFDRAEAALGPVTALVIAHCQSVNSSIVGATVENFDRHFSVNARATWLLVREFGQRFRTERGRGRIIGITSDALFENVPYGASKAAMDRIILAAAREFGHLGVTANVINPGATDTGWMSEAQLSEFARETPLGRVSQPVDCANLVTFLCSETGGWISGQLLHSNGGVR